MSEISIEKDIKPPKRRVATKKKTVAKKQPKRYKQVPMGEVDVYWKKGW